ncbi:MAG: hypothetical protein IPM16_08775 [Chloroflexi bacterium]|nr:hypothetical protein [Chloroflexota bacterium]
MNATSTGTASTARQSAIVAAVVFALTLLVYQASPRSIDGQDTLDMAQTWLRHGIAASTILSSPRQLIESDGQGGELYLVRPDGERTSKKGILPSIALVPLLIAPTVWDDLPTRAVAMLLNPLVTAATCGVLYAILRRMRFNGRISAVSSLLYGVGTMALVLAGSLFGEPLAAFLLLAGVGALLEWTRRRDLRWLILAGAAFGLTQGVNLTYTALVGVAGLVVIGRGGVRSALGFGVPAALALALVLLDNLARFDALTGYRLGQSEGFTTPLALGLYGNWLSPYRGVFWYSPLMLLAVWGSIGSLLRRRAGTALRTWLALALALTFVQSIVYGLWWAWDGAYGWGPRFLLPILPLWIPFVAAAIRGLWIHRPGQILVGAVAAFSILVSVLGAVTDYVPYYEGRAISPALDPSEPMFAAALDQIRQGAVLTPAWLEYGVDGVHFAAVGAILIAAWAAWRFGGRAALIALTCVALAGSAVIALRQQARPDWAVVQQIRHDLIPAAPALVGSFEIGPLLMDVNNDQRFVVTNPQAPVGHPPVKAQIDALSGDLMWYVTWFLPGDPSNWIEESLWRDSAFVRETTAAGHRALLFDTSPLPEADQPGGWSFGPITLARYGVDWSGSRLSVVLEWTATESLKADHAWFVHVVGPDGQIIQQQDRPPLGGYEPTSTWTAGETVRDSLVFVLPDSVDISQCTLRIGWSTISESATGPEGSDLEDPFIVIPLG